MQICKTVTLRTKKLKNGMLSYYLDYYPGLRDNITMKIVRHEFIGIYIYPDPKTKEEIQFNKEMAKKAEVSDVGVMRMLSVRDSASSMNGG